MPIKAILKAHKNGFYIIFTPGMRVSMVQSEFGYEPRRPYMTEAQKQTFASASAGISYDALIESLEEIKDVLGFYEIHPEDIISVLEAVMFYRNNIRGRAIESLSPSQEARVWRMMGEEPYKSNTCLDFDSILKGMMDQ